MSAIKKVVVASGNAVKRQAAETAFARMFPGESFEFEGLSVASLVADQPTSDVETYQGCKNRLDAVVQKTPEADFWISFEGGVEEGEHGLGVFAWVLARSNKGTLGKGRTSTFFLPEAVASLIRDGMELGDADDRVFGRQNSKQANGSIGLLTNDAITRSGYYAEAATLALIPFIRPDLYPTA